MPSNYWEELDMNEELKNFHEGLMGGVELPQWIKDIKCPFCKEEIPLRSVRSIQICFNARNFGDIAIEVFCDDCSKIDTLYYRECCDSIPNFVELLHDKKAESEAVSEREMYKMGYNNVMERMVRQTET